MPMQGGRYSDTVQDPDWLYFTTSTIILWELISQQRVVVLIDVYNRVQTSCNKVGIGWCYSEWHTVYNIN